MRIILENIRHHKHIIIIVIIIKVRIILVIFQQVVYLKL